MKRLLTFLTLVVGMNCASAQLIWHHPDTLIALPNRDTINYTEGYTVIAVVKSNVPESKELLWGIRSNDTLQSAFLTNAIFGSYGGVMSLSRRRDFSKWSVFYYRTGCKMDSTKLNELWLGPTMVLYTDSLEHVDTLSANVQLKELVFNSDAFTRVEAGSWQSYLAMKYGITLDYAPYISPINDTLWHHETDADYYNRIVAIGADSLHQWNARQSSSLEAASLQLIASIPLAEGEYILLGDNDQQESWSMMPDGSDQLLRMWRMRSHVQDEYICMLAWKPTIDVRFPDSVWVDVRDEYDAVLATLPVDSIVGDSVWYFTYQSRLPMVHFTIRTINADDQPTSDSEVSYNASTGTVNLTMLDPDKVYSYALYTRLGQLLFHPSPSRPDNVNVGFLPTGVYRLDAFDGNVLVASVPVIVP